MNKKNEKQIENDEIHKKYVKCYREWCAEIDEMTKPMRVDIKIYEQDEYDLCIDCNCEFFNDDNRKEHNRSLKHMKAVIKENKYMLDWRIYKSENKLNSND